VYLFRTPGANTFPRKFSGVLGLRNECAGTPRDQGTFSFTRRALESRIRKQSCRCTFPEGWRRFPLTIPGPQTLCELTPEGAARALPGQAGSPLEAKGEHSCGWPGIKISQGEYSEWVELEFRAGVGVSVREFAGLP